MMMHIKICGITTLSDALAAIDAGADMLGFNFYPASPRFIQTNVCAEISEFLHKEHPEIILVGVFVNKPSEEALRILRDCSLHLAQLHGDESPDKLKDFNGKAYKAFRGVPGLEDLKNYLVGTSFSSPALLLDAPTTGLYGGSGKTVDWYSAAELANKYPILLAGGLKPENIADALLQVKPWGVDAASGVEIHPGKKDPKKMRAFVQAVRNFAVSD
jgi:phosphoribosylanthranilate isomerase